MSTNNNWNNAVAAANSAITLNSGTNQLNISTDASNTTVLVGSGAAVKLVTLGSTNTTSGTTISSGSANIIANTGLTVDSTGRNYNTKQPTFLVHLSATTAAITGDGTLATIVWNTKDYDIGTNFNASTGVFTAPITAKYAFFTNITFGSLTALYTSYANDINTASNTIRIAGFPGIERDASNRVSTPISFIGQMTAGDTAQVRVNVSGSTKAVTVLSASADTSQSFFSGTLIC